MAALAVRSEVRAPYETEPPPAPQTAVDELPKCWRCNRTLGEYFARPWSLRCQRCGATNKSRPPE